MFTVKQCRIKLGYKDSLTPCRIAGMHCRFAYLAKQLNYTLNLHYFRYTKHRKGRSVRSLDGFTWLPIDKKEKRLVFLPSVCFFLVSRSSLMKVDTCKRFGYLERDLNLGGVFSMVIPFYVQTTASVCFQSY